MDEQQAPVDFFISYTTADREWAEWVAWQLEIAGYSVTLQAWDFRPGRDFLHEMNWATRNARRTIAILSPDYFASEFGEAEWRTAFAQDPTGERGLLVPVRVRNFQPAGLLATRVYIDLVDTNAAQAVDALLRGVSDRGARPTQEPPFPGSPPDPAVPPRFPGTRSSGRLKLFESYRAASRSVDAGDALISLFPEAAQSDVPSHIAIKRSEFESLHDLLDELFISCLYRRVSPYSYGAE